MKLLHHDKSWAAVRVGAQEAELIADAIDAFFESANWEDYTDWELDSLRDLRLKFVGINHNDYAPFLRVQHRK